MRHRASSGSGRRATRRPISGSAFAAIVAVGVIAVACRTHDRRPVTVAAPVSDFLLSAGDSTFWITTGPQGIRVRGSPLVLAHYGGRFYEVYVADEDHSFSDAVFTTQRIYRRDLMTGDSAAVFRDTVITAAARRYAAAHPRESPLPSGEDAAEDPSTSITGQVDIVNVEGPYLSFEYRRTSATQPTAGNDSDSTRDRANQESLRRGVVDLRSGLRATLGGMFGSPAADSVSVRGRRAFIAAVDSVQAARRGGDERAKRAAEAIGEFTFDPLSFTVTDLDQGPVVQFFAPGGGAHGSGLILPLPLIPVVAGASTVWWTAERSSLPVGGSDSASDLWVRPSLEVIARYDTAGGEGPSQGQGVVVSIRLPRRSNAPGKGGGQAGATEAEWRVGHFPAPTRRLFWLDVPPFDSAARRALMRAFDESALYGDDTRSAELPAGRLKGRPSGVAFAALRAPRLPTRTSTVSRRGRSRR